VALSVPTTSTTDEILLMVEAALKELKCNHEVNLRCLISTPIS